MSSRIEQIIEEIEEYVDSCKFQPLSTTKIVVNKEELEELLRELRLKTPDEIKRYQKIISNKDAILADAQSKADGIIASAEARAREMVSQHEVMQQAYAQANDTINKANQQAQQILDSATQDANKTARSLLRRQGRAITPILIRIPYRITINTISAMTIWEISTILTTLMISMIWMTLMMISGDLRKNNFLWILHTPQSRLVPCGLQLWGRIETAN